MEQDTSFTLRVCLFGSIASTGRGGSCCSNVNMSPVNSKVILSPYGRNPDGRQSGPAAGPGGSRGGKADLQCRGCGASWIEPAPVQAAPAAVSGARPHGARPRQPRAKIAAATAAGALRLDRGAPAGGNPIE